MMENNAGWRLDNSYTGLPECFFVRQAPVAVTAPEMAIFNQALAKELGLLPEALTEENGIAIFAGNRLPEGADPIAQAYAGHQFGHFTKLGDGRAILLGEQITPEGKRYDIQLKGSGQTAFSRRGDGRAALGPMLREYIISEAMHALGIPTTRSLAVVTTGEPVFRETVLPGAVLTRVAASHIRVGTFEYAALQGKEALQALADYTLQRHYPEAAETENPYLALLHWVAERQARLVSQWLLVGFIHGVMNTDNMALSGETIDYGPCAFMDRYHPGTVFSSIDRMGRYAYANQPMIAQWNLARFAEALLPLLHEEEQKAIALAEEALDSFMGQFRSHWLAGMRRKLGLFNEEPEDITLIEQWLEWMQQHEADYTNSFRALASETMPQGEPFHHPSFQEWYARWQARLERNPKPRQSSLCLMRSVNPAVIPRNHRVEEALSAATEQQDYQPLHRLLASLAEPYHEKSEFAEYREPPQPSDRVYQTFCGT